MRSDGRTDSGPEIGSSAVRNDDGGSSSEDLSFRLFGVLLAAVVVVLDQATKWWALTFLDESPVVFLPSIFYFDLAFNTGAAFSLFAGSGEIIAVLAIGITGFLIYLLGSVNRRIEAVALGLVLGGAVGNLLDRLIRGTELLDGAVVDFIEVTFFATFNVADIAINVGVLVLLVSVFWKRA